MREQAALCAVGLSGLDILGAVFRVLGMGCSSPGAIWAGGALCQAVTQQAQETFPGCLGTIPQALEQHRRLRVDWEPKYPS